MRDAHKADLFEFRIDSGEISIDFNQLPRYFVGHTGSGTFPPAGISYTSFSCQVQSTAGHRGHFTLAFQARNTDGELLLLAFDQKGADDSEWRVQVGVRPGASITGDHKHVLADIGGATYCSTGCTDLPPGEYKEVDLLDLLKYLEHELSEYDLQNRLTERRVEDPRDVKIRELQAEVKCLKEYGQLMQDQLTIKSRELQERYEALAIQAMALCDTVSAVKRGVIGNLLFGRLKHVYLSAKKKHSTHSSQRLKQIYAHSPEVRPKF